MLTVRVTLVELDTKVRKDTVAKDVDAIIVGNEGDESVELEGVRGFTLELLPPNFFAKRLLQTEIFSTTNGKISTTNGKKLSP